MIHCAIVVGAIRLLFSQLFVKGVLYLSILFSDNNVKYGNCQILDIKGTIYVKLINNKSDYNPSFFK